MSNEISINDALQKGIEAHKAGKVQEADKYYTAILKAQPDHPDANHNIGVLAVGVGKVEQALPFFKKALDTNPKIEQFWLSYIDALIKLSRLDDAKAMAPPDPPSPIIIEIFGTVSAMQHSIELAIADACPLCSAPKPGYAPGVSIKVITGI